MTTEEKLMKLPIVFDWVEYKGETLFMNVNYQESERVGRPMVDLYYCATRALNDCNPKLVQWDKKKFKPSKLAHLKDW